MVIRCAQGIEALGSLPPAHSKGVPKLPRYACAARAIPPPLPFAPPFSPKGRVSRARRISLRERETHYAQELTEGTTEIPPTLRHYIDYDAIARDIELNGDVFTIETAHNEVHVFWQR